MKEIKRYYWNSSVFCSFLNEEPDRFQVVEDLLKEARSGNIEIVTSSFTTVEVLKLKGSAPITDEMEKEVVTFFEFPFIKLYDANRNVCELARQFVWKHGLAPKDAVHMATASLAAKLVTIDGLFSWDTRFLKLNGKVPGISFQLSVPFITQALLPLEEAGSKDKDSTDSASENSD